MTQKYKYGDWRKLTAHLKKDGRPIIRIDDDELQGIAGSVDETKPYAIDFTDKNYCIRRRAGDAGYDVMCSPEDNTVKVFTQRRSVMNKLGSNGSWIALALAVAAIVLLSVLVNQAQRQNAALRNIIANGLNSVDAKIEQQSMLINRALGKVIPLVLPPAVQAQIAEIEAQLSDESKWPRDAQGVQKLNEKLAALVNALPPWAQEELLPRILPRRWEIDALWVLTNMPDNTEATLLSHAKALESLLDQKPLNVSDSLAQKLTARQTHIEILIAQAEKASALSRAKAALSGDGDAEAALRQLTAYEDENTKALAVQLRERIVKKEFSNEIVALRKQLDGYTVIDNATLKEYAYSRAYQTTLDLRLRMTALHPIDAALSKELSAVENTITSRIAEISKAKQQREANIIKQYQLWALGEIKKVRSYDAISKYKMSKIPSTVDRNNPFSSPRKAVDKDTSAIIRDDLIKFMSRINQGFLDEAVNQLFRKVYQTRFDKLNENDQLLVVQGFAVANKYPLE